MLSVIKEIINGDFSHEQKLDLIKKITHQKNEEQPQNEQQNTDSQQKEKYENCETEHYKIVGGKRVLHRLDGPAIDLPNGVQIWYKDGKMHRNQSDDELVNPSQPAFIDGYGNKKWYINGELHRINAPAIIHSDGRHEYLVNGAYHSFNDLPAKVEQTGTKYWYNHGKFYRDDDKPNYIQGNVKGYIINSKYGFDFHRDGDKPAYFTDDGSIIYYYKNGKLHRDGDKPAKFHKNGAIEYYSHGQLHRGYEQIVNSRIRIIQPGPAKITADGTIYYSYNGCIHREPGTDGIAKPAIINASGDMQYYTHGEKYDP